jgi:RHS repeat-associated protein
LALGEQIGASTQFFLRDHLGNVTDVTDGTAGSLARYNFDPSGRRTLTVGNDVTAIGFTGHRQQLSAGLWLTWHRAYDPVLGRWLSQDPIGFEAGPNFYTYALNNPTNWTDPFGLDVTVCFYSDAAMGFGHVGFGVSGESGTSGYYPDGIQEDKQKDKQCKTIKTPPEKDKCMVICRDQRRANPGEYSLFSRQCTSFVRDCLKECQIFSGDYDGPRPRKFFGGLSSK